MTGFDVFSGMYEIVRRLQRMQSISEIQNILLSEYSEDSRPGENLTGGFRQETGRVGR